MRNLFPALLLVLSIVLPGAALAGEGATACSAQQDDTIAARSLEGQALIFERRYADAKALFDQLSSEYPDSPAGSFGLMAVAEVQMLEREGFHLEKEFLAAAQEGIARSNRLMQCHRPSTWQLFLAGSVLGLDGFFKARHDQWWEAYTQGGKSRQIFRRVKQMEPGFIDADFGLGMYLFWRSVFTRDLWFLHMFPDKRAEGIAIVERVAREARYTKDMARVNLVIMYFEEKRFEDARKLLDEYLGRYPQNIVLRRLMGKVQIALKQYDNAVQQFRTIIKQEPAITQSHYFIGVALVLKGNPAQFDEAQRELTEFLRVQPGKYWPASAHYWLGRLADARGDKETAVREYQAAIALDPKIQDALKRARGLGGGV